MKKLSLLLAFLLLFGTIGTTVFGAQTSIMLDYNPDTKIVNLTGNTMGNTIIRLTLHETSPEILSDGNLPVDLHQIKTYGSLNYSFYLPESAPSAKYDVYVSDRNGNSQVSFLYFSKDEADIILNTKVKPATGKNEFVLLVTSDAAGLGIDKYDEEYKEASIALMHSLYNSRNYTDSVDFYSKYNYCKAICQPLGKNRLGVEASLEKYQSLLGINYNTNYKNNALLTDDVKSTLCNLISNMDYGSEKTNAETITGKKDYPAYLDALSAIAVLKNSGSWKAFEEVYTKKFTFLKNNIVSKNADYKNVAASDVYSNLMTMEFNSVIDLKTNFDNAVKLSNNPTPQTPSTQQKPSKPGTVGGGISMPSNPGGNTVVFDELPTYQDNTVDDKDDNVLLKMPKLSDEKQNFADVNQNDWFYPAVSTLAGSGIVSGDINGNFRPQDNITRAEFAKLIVSAFSVPEGKAEFADVPETSWYAPYVSNAAACGIVGGYEGKFNPDSYITRQDAAVIIYRVSKLFNIEYTGFEEADDMENVSLYAWTAVGTLMKNGIVNGVGDGSFMPLSNITRAEAVQLLYNSIISMADAI